MTTMPNFTYDISSEGRDLEKDCPICMEVIEFASSLNYLVTQCGHAFHTSCLLNNVLHNGFGCPCCRRTLVDFTREDVSEVRRREIERQMAEERDVFNQTFYEEDEDEIVERDAVDTEIELMEERIHDTEDWQRINDRLSDFVINEGLDEWEEGDRVWNRERRREERAFLGMRIMFQELGDTEGFYRDRERFDWMDSEEDSSETELADDGEEELHQEPDQIIGAQQPNNNEENEDDSDSEEENVVDEIMDREHQLARNNDMPSPHDLAIELQRYGFYLIDYVRIIIDYHYQEEYRGIIGDYNLRPNVETLRESITRVMRQYRREALIEREIDAWRNNNVANQPRAEAERDEDEDETEDEAEDEAEEYEIRRGWLL